VKYYGLSFGFLINAISFVPILVVLPMIPSKHKTINNSDKSFFKDLVEGVRFVSKNKTMSLTFYSLIVYAFFGMPYGMLMQAFAKSAVKTGLVGYGLMMESMGLGGTHRSSDCRWNGTRTRYVH
jgi:hypothetical protein